MEDDSLSAAGNKAEYDRTFSSVLKIVEDVVLDTAGDVQVVSIDDLRSNLIADFGESGIPSSYRTEATVMPFSL